MATGGLTGSAVNELEVSEREFEHRNRAIHNLSIMKSIENTWQKISTKGWRGSVVCKFKPKK